MTARRSPWPDVRRMLATLGLAALLDGSSTALTAQRAEVEVELRIESALFSGGLGAAKGTVERNVAAWLAGELEKTLSYVDWVGKVPDRPRPAYGLVAKMIDHPGTGCGTRVDLVFGVRTAGGEADFPPEWTLAVGDECDLDLPTQDGPGLEALLHEKLGRRLSELLFRQAIERLLTSGVPLAKEVRLREESIAVPFSPAELKAGVDTKFRVEFSAKEGGATRTGEIEMLLRRAAAWGGICRVALFQFGAFAIPSAAVPAGVEWHPRFAQILSPENLSDVTIWMSDYHQTLNPVGGLADAPVSEP